MARNVATALALLVIGALLFSVGPAMAGWVIQRSWTLPASYTSHTVTALTCADKTEHPLQTNTVSVEMWNTNAVRDVCLAWTGDPDITDLTTCDIVLGKYAGSGNSNVYQTPPTLSFGGLTFKCDAAAGTVIRVTEFVGPAP